jgi:hypothetical protein
MKKKSLLLSAILLLPLLLIAGEKKQSVLLKLDLKISGSWYARPTGKANAEWEFLAHTPGAVELSNSNEYKFKVSWITTLEEFKEIESLKSVTGLKYLDLTECNLLTDEWLEHVGKLGNIERLELTDYQLDEKSKAVFKTKMNKCEILYKTRDVNKSIKRKLPDILGGRVTLMNTFTGECGRACMPENYIRISLRWLHFHKDKGGRMSAGEFEKKCAGGKWEKCGGAGKIKHMDTSVTALSLLAFLGAGFDQHTGAFCYTVRSLLRYFRKHQQPNGRFGQDKGKANFYNHLLASLAVFEAYAQTGDYVLKPMAERALKFCLASKNADGAWSCAGKGGKSDTDTTCWMVLALKMAEAGGFKVSADVYKGIRKWLDKATSLKGKMYYQGEKQRPPYTPASGEWKYQEETMTAMAIFARILMGEDRNSETIQKGVKYLIKNPPVYDLRNKEEIDFYYWHWATLAMYQVGGEGWRKWRLSIKRALLKTQRRGGCSDGSWSPVGVWGKLGGRVYATAINALTLEDWRYKRVE